MMLTLSAKSLVSDKCQILVTHDRSVSPADRSFY